MCTTAVCILPLLVHTAVAVAVLQPATVAAGRTPVGYMGAKLLAYASYRPHGNCE